MPTQPNYFRCHLSLALLFCAMCCYAQQPRQLLRGRVVADSVRVDNINVMNLTSRIRAITDDKGKFTMYAKANDTLYFSGVSYRSRKLVLREEHFGSDEMVIQLDVNVITLDEVVITPRVLSGNLGKDSKDTKTMKINSQIDSGAILAEMGPVSAKPVPTENLSPLRGVDFVAIYKMIFKKKRAKQDRGEIYGKTDAKPFATAVQDLYTHYFFTETLKIPHSEIGLFLTFCDKGEATRALLAPDKEFELTDYLISQSREYLKKGK